MVLIPLLAACSSAVPERPADLVQERGAAIAVPSLILESGTWISSLQTELVATGAPANTRVYFLASADLNGAGACPAQTAPVCLALAAPIVVLGSVRADANGVAILTPTVPNPAPAAELEIQAVTLGASPVASNAEIVQVHGLASDLDGDGLTAGDELLLGTDPATADTDGDSFDDGTEVAAGTSPVDALDRPLTYADDVYPLFANECAGCHTGNGNSGGLNLDDYVDVVDRASLDVPTMDRIEPFAPDDSYLFHKLSNTQLTVGGAGSRMPKVGPALTVDELALVEDWILEGALP